MLKAAIIGCGKIADSHAAAIRLTVHGELVAVCDREELMARQLAERFRVPRVFCDAADLLRTVRPDVVHITTPPESHFAVAMQCLEAGSHVFLEKPFTITTAEAEELIGCAIRRRLNITVGHDEQFSHAARRMRQLVREGYLGGAPVHIESAWCYSLGDQVYAKALLSDPRHWVRTLPGGLLQNVISHGVAKIAEFLDGEFVEVVAVGRTSEFLRRLGEDRIIDELRVVITSLQGATAYFTFSSQIQPAIHQLWLYGPTNGLFVDEDRQTVLQLPGGRYKSYLEQFVPPLRFAKQYVSAWARSVRLFLNRDFQVTAGRNHLVDEFYRSIGEATAPPIPYREILLTSRIMEAIFEQTGASRPSTGRNLVGAADALVTQ